MSFQFYPTGEKTAALMWSKFKNPVEHLCEPSAGQGHLIRYSLEGFLGLSNDQIPWLSEDNPEMSMLRKLPSFRNFGRSKLEKSTPISVIEIDANHHPILRQLSSKIKIVGYDFLQIESLATVSHVIMNPPFSEGVKHVLHAWELVFDAEIVAIVNAETIRNPFSQERKVLIDLIQKNGSVEFFKDQFIDNVERVTAVEIALIYLRKKPENDFDLESIVSELKPRKLIEEINPEICSALALPENFIENTYRRYQIAVNSSNKAVLAEAIAKSDDDALGMHLEQMQSKGVENSARIRKNNDEFRKKVNALIRERTELLNRKAWAQVIRSSLLTDKLSNQARRKVEAEAEVIYQLQFCIPNVHGFLAGLYASLGDIYSDMICGLFDSIIGRSSDNVVFYKSWKSNEKHRFGMRIRKTRFILPVDTCSDGTLNYESGQFIADIDKVFGYLHGVSEKYDGLVDAFNKKLHSHGKRAISKYFEYRFYLQAGTIHIFPKTQEVIEKLNRFVGARRQWLPDQMESANDDFNTQYDNAEILTKQYIDAMERPKSRISPQYALLRNNPSEDDLEVCQLMCESITRVHRNNGLQCGPALSHTSPPSGTSQQILLLDLME